MSRNSNYVDLPDFGMEVRQLNGAKVGVKITANKRWFTTAVQRTQRYKALPYRLRPALERVADYVRVEMIPRTFEKEGPGWAPLANRTMRERQAQGFNPTGPILQRSGDLYAELTQRTHPKHYEVIRTGKNARIEIGGTSEKFVRNQLGQGIAGQHLPRRSMIPGTGGTPLTDRDRLAIKTILRNAIKSAWGK